MHDPFDFSDLAAEVSGVRDWTPEPTVAEELDLTRAGVSAEQQAALADVRERFSVRGEADRTKAENWWGFWRWMVESGRLNNGEVQS